MLILPQGAADVAARRRKGEILLALSVVLTGNPTGPDDWRGAPDADAIFLDHGAPLGAYSLSCAAGLVCLVHDVRGNPEPAIRVAEGLFRAPAFEVWLLQEGGYGRLRPILRDRPVFIEDERLSAGQILSRARVERAARLAGRRAGVACHG